MGRKMSAMFLNWNSNHIYGTFLWVQFQSITGTMPNFWGLFSFYLIKKNIFLKLKNAVPVIHFFVAMKVWKWPGFLQVVAVEASLDLATRTFSTYKAFLRATRRIHTVRALQPSQQLYVHKLEYVISFLQGAAPWIQCFMFYPQKVPVGFSHASKLTSISAFFLRRFSCAKMDSESEKLELPISLMAGNCC